mmetsp:Transcript_6887/g.10900  ORF Transcript_6887/g.10900 Transcript_6887/m.10900 type:complete len:99 (-) Transcript_6887:8-304(-)
MPSCLHVGSSRNDGSYCLSHRAWSCSSSREQSIAKTKLFVDKINAPLGTMCVQLMIANWPDMIAESKALRERELFVSFNLIYQENLVLKYKMSLLSPL